MTSFSEFYCDDCNRAFSTLFWLRQHLAGRPHAAFMAQKAALVKQEPTAAPAAAAAAAAADEEGDATPPPTEYASKHSNAVLDKASEAWNEKWDRAVPVATDEAGAASPPPPLVRTSRPKQQRPVKRRMIEYVAIDGSTSRRTVESSQLPRLVDQMRARDASAAEQPTEPQPAATITIFYAAGCPCSNKGRKAQITASGDMISLYHLCENCVAVNKRIKLVV